MCEYCKGDSTPIINRFVSGAYVELGIDNLNLYSIFDNHGHAPVQNSIYIKEVIKINYCPICGRNLNL